MYLRKTYVFYREYRDKTASWKSAPIDLGGFEKATIFINVKTLTGTAPTVDVTINQLPTDEWGEADQDNPVTLDEDKQSLEGSAAGIFVQWTAPDIRKSTIHSFGQYIQLVFTLGGTVTDCDVNVHIIAKA